MYATNSSECAFSAEGRLSDGVAAAVTASTRTASDGTRIDAIDNEYDVLVLRETLYSTATILFSKRINLVRSFMQFLLRTD